VRNQKRSGALLILAALALAGAPLSLAQTQAAAPVERLFHESKAQVNTAVQKLQPATSGHLPVLDGFVGSTTEPLERYSRGYFQCTIRVTEDVRGGSLVDITASITAWYTDLTGSRSGYRVLASNGRLESDFLDSLSDLLSGGTPGALGSRPSLPRDPKASAPRATKPAAPPANPAQPSAPPPAAKPAPGDDSLEGLRQRREQAEARLKELRSENQNLEEILRNVAHPNDLVVVRKAETPVYAKPESGAKVLFIAEVDDEFQVLDKETGWVHIQISGLSRGWIRRSQVDLPEGQAEDTRAASPDDAASSPYITEKQETDDFSGDWDALRGKTVRIFWVGSNPKHEKPATASERLEFARSLLLGAYQNLSGTSAAVSGIVIVFDSADGGEIAATMASLKEWMGGKLTESEFWKQCLLDPADMLQPTAKS
jgi:hypothetical protein